MKKLFSYGAGEFLNKGLNILLILLLPLFLTPEDYGTVSILIGIESILILILLMGQNNVLLRFFHNFKNREKFLNSIFFIWIRNSIVFLVVSSVLLLFLYKITLDSLYLYLLILVPIVILSTFREIHLILFRVLERVKDFIFLKAFYQIQKIIFIFILIYMDFNVLAYPLGALVAVVSIFIFEVLSKNRVFTFKFLSYQYYKEKQFHLSKLLFLFGMPLMIHMISNLLLVNSDRFLIYYMMSAEDVGIYSLAYTISSSMIFFMYIAGLVFLPSFYKNHKTYTCDAKKALQKMTTYNLIVSIIVGSFIWLMAYFYIPVYGKEYSSVMDFLLILLISYIIYPLYLHGNYKAMLMKKNKEIPKATFMALSMNILLNIFLIPNFGLLGAAVATLIGNIILIILINIIGTKKINNKGIYSGK